MKNHSRQIKTRRERKPGAELPSWKRNQNWPSGQRWQRCNLQTTARGSSKWKKTKIRTGRTPANNSGKNKPHRDPRNTPNRSEKRKATLRCSTTRRHSKQTSSRESVGGSLAAHGQRGSWTKCRVRPPFCVHTCDIHPLTYTHTHSDSNICGSSKYDAEVCMTAIANGCRRGTHGTMSRLVMTV